MPSEGPVRMDWEQVTSESQSGLQLMVHRCKVRGGWLVNIVAGGPLMNTIFIADERHRWTEGWDDPSNIFG